VSANDTGDAESIEGGAVGGVVSHGDWRQPPVDRSQLLEEAPRRELIA
jgi:hypothetical protein